MAARPPLVALKDAIKPDSGASKDDIQAKIDTLKQNIIDRFDRQMSVFTTSAQLLDDHRPLVEALNLPFNLRMTGPATAVFEGTIDIPDLS